MAKREIILSGPEELVAGLSSMLVAIQELVEGEDWTIIQDWLMTKKGYNGKVKAHFADIQDDTPIAPGSRAAARAACLIKESDSALLALHKRLNFYLEERGGRDLWPTFYGEPSDTFKDKIPFKQQLHLFFAQDSLQVKEGYASVRAECNIRLVGENEIKASDTDWQAKVNRLAKKIYQEFAATHPPYTWKKGKIICNYIDKEYCYKMHIYVSSETQGKELIKKILDIQGHSYNEKNLTVTIPKRTTQEVSNSYTHKLGVKRRKARWRPIADVRFRYAFLRDWEVEKDICLVDTTGYFLDALYKK